MANKFLVASHGKMASGIKSSIHTLANKGDEIKTIDAYVDDSDYTAIIQDFLKSLQADDRAVIFTDLYGGSVNQRVVRQVLDAGKQEQVSVVSNANLAVILSIVMTGNLTKEAIQGLLEESQVCLVELEAKEETTDDFFD
ncbi:PTS mannose transporter subunit IIA [Atopobacter sp. AH10]|uniref:PTS sugar transporter subunit IIA n=1 Tax=Atopobacter sp. AH10 TaxID=2315861 RepID=UPI000EF21DA3|nr:PTS mannose transporter subunit IIA [Atopobacter sp. AH10]RLK62906.1 PTS mannose transporter subunit IIA [Atopobacter sp. AH10]